MEVYASHIAHILYITYYYPQPESEIPSLSDDRSLEHGSP